MPNSTSFRLNRSGLLLALVSAAFAGQAGAAAGRVEFALGTANVVGTDGRTRPAAKGTELDTGDVVRTNEGRVQVRMTDGAFISLQPNTEFGIKNYKFEGKTDGSESALYSLVKGAMRTVTGLIGRVNRNRYQVATPTATVGIRGTGGLIQVLNDGSTLVQGTSGIWFLANPAGSIDVPAGVGGIAPVDPKQPPKETVQIPTAGPSPLPPIEEFEQGEERKTDGENIITPPGLPPLTPVLQSGSGYAAAMVFGVSGASPDMAFGTNATATFDATGRLTAIPDLSFEFYTLGAGGVHADFGTDGILAWGRWTGPVTGDTSGECALNENYNANQGLHYVVGLPTASMPSSGTASYALLGATSPTYLDGSTAPGTLTGNLSVDFGRFTVGIALNAAMPDGKGYQIGGSAIISGNTFSGSHSFGQGSLATSGTGGACSSGCNALVQGFFAGTTAERAGLAYHVQDILGPNVIGTAAFTKQ